MSSPMHSLSSLPASVSSLAPQSQNRVLFKAIKTVRFCSIIDRQWGNDGPEPDSGRRCGTVRNLECKVSSIVDKENVKNGNEAKFPAPAGKGMGVNTLHPETKKIRNSGSLSQAQSSAFTRKRAAIASNTSTPLPAGITGAPSTISLSKRAKVVKGGVISFTEIASTQNVTN